MASIFFGNKIDLTIAATPSDNSFLIAYDLDGVLKQKDEFGVITPIGTTSSSGGPIGPTGATGPQGDIGLTGATGPSGTSVYDMSFAISDEETPITTGTEKVTLFTPRAFTLTNVKASLSNSGSTQTEIDIKVNGLSILSTNITIDAGDKKSVDALTQPVISNSNISEDDEITVDIVSAGSGATGAKIYLIGTI